MHTKTFIKRDGSVDVRTERLYYWGHEEFLLALSLAGFEKVIWDCEDETKRVVLVE